MPEEEYEIIPTSPIRRLEKRMEKMETSAPYSQIQKLIEEIVELIKSNQRIIDEVIKANAELRDELSHIPKKIDQLLGSMNEFMRLLKAASEEEVAGTTTEAMKPLVDKFSELIEQNKHSLEMNQASITALETIDKRLKRLYLAFASLYRK